MLRNAKHGNEPPSSAFALRHLIQNFGSPFQDAGQPPYPAISNPIRSERAEATKGSVEFKGRRVDRLTPTISSGEAASSPWRSAVALRTRRSKKSHRPAEI
jgi:hypothetical protein